MRATTVCQYELPIPGHGACRSLVAQLFWPDAAICRTFFSPDDRQQHTHTLQCFLNSVPSPVFCLGEDKDYKTHKHLWI